MRSAAKARSSVGAARIGVSVYAMLAAFGVLLLVPAAPALAGGNEEDQPAYTPPPRPAAAAPRAAAPAPRPRGNDFDYQTIVIGGASSTGVIVDMSVLDELTGEARPARPARPRAAAPAAARPASPPPPPAAAAAETPPPPPPPVAAAETPAPEPEPAPTPEPTPAPVAEAPPPAPPPPPARPMIDSATPRTIGMVELGARLDEPAVPAAPPPPATAEAPSPPPPPPASEAAPPAGEPTELAAALPPPPPPASTGLPSVARPVTQVAFETSGNELSAEARAALSGLVEQLKAPGGRILLRGFASGANDTATGARRLSLQRVQAVRTFLIENGVPANRIDLRAVGMAPDAPVADGVDIAIMP